MTAAAAAPTVTSPTSAAQIEKAPNFTADDLSAAPTDNWPTVGGSLRNERYSPLDQIDTSNVSQLKGVWMTHLDGSGVGAKYSAESQPVVWKGVMYVTTGNNDVFAVSVATGQDPLEIHLRHLAEDHDGLLRLAEPRRGDRRRPRVLRPARRRSRRARPADRQARLDEAARPVAARPDDHRRADLRRRHDLHRRRRRRVRHAVVPPGARRRDRKAGLALVHDRRPRRSGRQTHGRQGRRSICAAARRSGRRRPSTRSSD